METLRRSVVKSLVWRVLGFAILGALSYVFTGSWTETLGITVTFNLIRVVLYVVHEQLWDRIAWGRTAPQG